MRVDLAAASDVATAVAGSKEGSCGAGLGGGGGEGWGDGVGGPKCEVHCTMEPDTMPNNQWTKEKRPVTGLLQGKEVPWGG